MFEQNNLTASRAKLVMQWLCVLSLLPAALLNAAEPVDEGGTRRLRIVFAGDIMGHDSQIEAARTGPGDTFDYTSCFASLQPCLDEADIAVGNLEVTLAGPPYKGYPRFSSPDTLIDALMSAGFNVLVNANNHALDRGQAGLERTNQVLRNKGIPVTGVFISGEQRARSYPLLVEKNGILVAFLNYTYGTNGIRPDEPNIVNTIDTLQIRRDLHKVRLAEPDFIIACMHWGTEYEREAGKTQKEIARFLQREGVDAIIGSHPHVVQPVEYKRVGSAYRDLVVYSLGNFISNQRNRYRNGGILFGMELVKEAETRIRHIDYLPVYVHKPVINGKTVFRMIPSSASEAQIRAMQFTEQDRKQFRDFLEDTRTQLPNVPEYRPDAQEASSPASTRMRPQYSQTMIFFLEAMSS